MIHKQTIKVHKPWLHMDSFGLHLHEMAAKLKRSIRFEVPTGYQDETGFHMGVKPQGQGIKWPPVW
jgi:hypothetical protein